MSEEAVNSSGEAGRAASEHAREGPPEAAEPAGGEVACARPSRWLAGLTGWSPALAALAIVLLYVIYVPLFINNCNRLAAGCQPPLIKEYLASHGLCACNPVCAIGLDDAARLWPGRFLWVFTTGVGLLANLLAVGVSLYVIWRSRAVETAGAAGGDARSRRAASRHVVYALLAFALIACGGLFVPPERMMSQMFQLLECTAKADLPLVTQTTNLANFISLAATVCVALASCAIVRAPGGGRRQGAAELAALMSRLRVLLYTGTAALVIYVLRVNIQANWALAYLSPQPDRKSEAALAMGNLASAFTSAQAASSTLLLAAIYIPAFFVLRARAVTLADEGLPPPKREQWLKDNGLSVSFTEHLPRIAAILGPLLAGPLGDLVSRLGK